MRSLQSLCLLRVHSLGLVQNALDIPLIPATLSKELKIMNLMNKTYSSGWFERDIFGSRVRQIGLSIQYDGVEWSFQFRGNVFAVLCCPHCDFISPDVGHLTMEEGKPGIVNSHFLKTLEMDLGRNEDFTMTLEFGMNENGTLGEISFVGCEDLLAPSPRVFQPKIQVEIKEGGQRELHCTWGSIFYLTETSVPVQVLLSTPAVSFCMSEVMLDISHELEFHELELYELEVLIVMSDVADEARNASEPEDFVEDFWKIVPSE